MIADLMCCVWLRRIIEWLECEISTTKSEERIIVYKDVLEYVRQVQAQDNERHEALYRAMRPQ
jgi:hypothetical protein